jgi:hypothetical protein
MIEESMSKESNMSNSEQFRFSTKSESASSIDIDCQRSSSDTTDGKISTKHRSNNFTRKRRQLPNSSVVPIPESFFSSKQRQQQAKFATTLGGSPDLTCLQFNNDGTLKLLQSSPIPKENRKVADIRSIDSNRLALMDTSHTSKGTGSGSVSPIVSIPTIGRLRVPATTELPSGTAHQTNNTTDPSVSLSLDGGLPEFGHESYHNCMTHLENINKQDDKSAMAQLHMLSVNPAVRTWRFIVLFVLLLCMIGTAVTVHEYMSSRERQEFEHCFRESVLQEVHALGHLIELTLDSIDVLVNNILTYANFTNQTWPFVTMGNFPLHASKTRHLAKARVLNIFPYVTLENRLLWEQFTAINHNWVNESIEFQYNSDDYYGGKIQPNYTSYNVIHGYDELDKPLEEQGKIGTDRISPPYYLPMWQSAPVIPTFPPYNWDLAGVFATNHSSVSIETVTQNVVLTEVYNIPKDADDDLAQTFVEWFKPFVPPDFNTSEPVADIYLPMLQRYIKANGSHLHSLHHSDTENFVMSQYNKTDKNGIPNDFVGIMSVSVFWRDWIHGLNAYSKTELHLVFDNPCNPIFTYEVVRHLSVSWT